MTPLPPVTSATEWPGEDWRRVPVRDPAKARAVSASVDFFFSETYQNAQGLPRALVVVQGGHIVAERYDGEHGCDQMAWTGSVAKMLGAVMAGLLTADGLLDIHGAAPVAAWQTGADDTRAAITPHHVLTMTAGLDWDDAYATKGLGMLHTDFMEMAFGDGYADSAAYTVAKPLAHAPGSFYRYNDGLPSVMGAIASQILGGSRESVRDLVESRLLLPMQMQQTELEFDLAGNWYGASGVRWSPCDLARFGYLLLRDGQWQGIRLLPEGWVDYMRSPTAASLEPSVPLSRSIGYGANAKSYVHPNNHALLDDVGHPGWGGSYLRVVPSLDLVIVLFGANGGGQGDFAVLDLAAETLINSFR